jgi:hypothetical protein
LGIRAEQHLAIGLEVDVQHVVRLLCPRMPRLKLDGLPEELHRPLPYVRSLPLHSDYVAVLIEQEHRRVRRVHLSFGELGLVEFPVYGVGSHSPGTLRARDTWALGHVPLGLYLLWSKPFVLLAQLSNLLGWIDRLSSAGLRYCRTTQ